MIQEEKLMQFLTDKFGISIVLLYFGAKYGLLWWKKINGNYVSYKEIMNKMHTLENKFNDHLRITDSRTGKIEIIEKTQEIVNKNLSEKINEVQSAIKEVNNKLSDLMALIIKNGK